MKYTYKIANLRCAHCAAQMEHSINKLPGVQRATINMISEKMVIEMDEKDFSAIHDNAMKIIRRIEPHVKVEII